MSPQKALYLLELHGKFSVQDKDVPEPGPGEVLVEVHSTALNPIDWKIPAYGIVVTTYPAILGLDAAGVVTKLGAGVSDVSLGEKVYVINNILRCQVLICPTQILSRNLRRAPRNVSAVYVCPC